MRYPFSRISLLVALPVLMAGAYIVKQGDTLWDLSATFLNDPFKWSDLWARNPQIQDPHWIYPGDSLNLDGAADTLSQVEEADTMKPSTPPPADSLLPKGVMAANGGFSRDDEFRRNLGNLPNKVDTGNIQRTEATRYTFRNSDAPAVFNLYYQLLAPVLVNKIDFQNDPSFYRFTFGDKSPGLLLHSGNEILLKVGRKGAPVQVGSIIELWKIEVIKLPLPKGDTTTREFVLKRFAAFAKLEAVGDTLSRARITQVMQPFDPIQTRARLAQKREILQVKGYEPVPEVQMEQMPRVRYAMDANLVVNAYSYVVADGGIAQGMAPGNGVAFLENVRQDPSLPPRVLGRGIVVSANQNESTILVRELYDQSRRIECFNRVAVTHRAIHP